MKRNIKRILIVILCVIFQLNSMIDVFAITYISKLNEFKENNTSICRAESCHCDACENYSHNDYEDCCFKDNCENTDVKEEVAYKGKTLNATITPIDTLTSNYTYSYHTSQGHKVYLKDRFENIIDQGYYVKLQNCTSCYTSPSVSIANIPSNTILGAKDTNFIPQIQISDVDNYNLECTYVINEEYSEQPSIDGEPETPGIPGGGDSLLSIGLPEDSYAYSKKDITENIESNSHNKFDFYNHTKLYAGKDIDTDIIVQPITQPIYSTPITVTSTRVSKTVAFTQGINANNVNLKQGTNKITIKVKIMDGLNSPGYAAIVNGYFTVDTLSPELTLNNTVYTNNATINVTATDASGGISYKYTFNGVTGNWTTINKSFHQNLTPNTDYSYKVETKDKVDNTGSTSGTITTKAEIPSINSATALSTNKIKLVYSDNNPIDRTKYGFKIEKKIQVEQ